MKALLFLPLCLSLGLGVCTIIGGPYPLNCDGKEPLDPHCIVPIPDVSDVLIAFSNAWTKMDHHHKVILCLSLGKRMDRYWNNDDAILVAMTDAILNHPEKHHIAMKFFESLKKD